jgi:hypothetical protein
LSHPAILIGPADALPVLKNQPYLRDCQAFADTDTNLALDAIREKLPPVIAIERNFAATASGQGFIRRIKADPALQRCEIEMVGIRRAERHKLSPTVDISLDGESATLLDVSVTGVHVMSPWSLKPKQRVRVALRAGAPPLTGIVVWAHFELPNEGPRYRAGIEFVASAAESVREFIATLT